nr:hypothetical protein JVH1_6681 [Rhodococcus sp. JVH1]
MRNSPSSISHTPSSNVPWLFEATRKATRVFPTPPTPVSVTRGEDDTRFFTSASSVRRSTKLWSTPAEGYPFGAN